MSIRRAYVQVGRCQIHYRCAGKKGAPVVVLLHQTPSTSEMYVPLMTALAEDYEVFALDTPGFGGSDAIDGPFSIPVAASALAAAMRWLRPGALHWFGHHTGAALALQVASTHPEQVVRLAMSGPCLLDDALRQRLPQLAAAVPPSDDGAHLQTLWARMTAKDADAPLAIRTREAVAGALAGASYPQAYAAVVAVDTQAQLRQLQCPTLVFAGTEDPLYAQLNAAFKLLRDGRRAEIPGARTYVCERQADQVASLLRDFFGASDV